MKHMKKYIITSLLGIAGLFSGITVNAQMYHTNHFMQSIPQASYGNPALMPAMNAYVGLPGISSVYVTLGHTGFAPNDFLRKNSSGLYWDQDYLINQLHNKNLLRLDANMDILGFGWRKGQNYYSFNFSLKNSVYFGYPGDLLTIALKGNTYFEDQAASFSGLGMDVTSYLEAGIGFAREFTDELTLGIRAKYLHGLGSLWFERNELSLYTDPETYALKFHADFLAHKSAPITIGPFDSLTSGNSVESDVEWAEWARTVSNPGFAFDLGGTYKINDQWMVGLSILDLGLIQWKNNVESYASDGDFEFNGFDVNEVFENNEFNEEFVEDLTDSIINIFDVTDGNESYVRYLSPKLHTSVLYTITPNRKAGFMFRGEIYKGQFYPGFTLSYNRKLLQALSTTLSYSYMNYNFYNVGAGFNVNLGPLQLYLVADNLLGALKPQTIQTVNLHFGLNLVFGYRQKKEPACPMFRY